MNRRRTRSEREPTIALINIVFLMLIFFLVAGTLAKPLDKDLRLVRTADLAGAAPADALVLHADGRMTYGGVAVASAADFFAGLPEPARTIVRIIPDRDLPAATLVAHGRALRAAGADRVVIVTEQGLQ
ncbi:biopolymer transporter ExbD [Loktanella sp. 5RATIMAR09]|uniref:ExbD/TolR family protein n=1 Tax=Loktanella sp. 5RATIMAR09 TaxID=1225655 RepID=UPI0006EB3D35|nr:biopolymer transporter ExbD [Loktanella sp. 5RATIMAR09]KQI72951.1 biopolymer transporter ExbD [Loktanella sp. 5RATIMAR09]